MAIQPFDSQQWIPWLEEVSVVSARPNSEDAANWSVPAGVYQQGGGELVPSRGVVVANNITATISTNDLDFTPKPYDRLLWQDVSYTILRVNTTQWMRFHTLTCLNLAIVAELAQTGSLLRATNTANGEGKRVPGFAVISANIPCRVQPQSGQQATTFDVLTSRNRYRATIGSAIYPQADDVFQVGSTKYTVKGWGDAELLDRLPYLDLEDLP